MTQWHRWVAERAKASSLERLTILDEQMAGFAADEGNWLAACLVPLLMGALQAADAELDLHVIARGNSQTALVFQAVNMSLMMRAGSLKKWNTVIPSIEASWYCF